MNQKISSRDFKKKLHTIRATSQLRSVADDDETKQPPSYMAMTPSEFNAWRFKGSPAAALKQAEELSVQWSEWRSKWRGVAAFSDEAKRAQPFRTNRLTWWSYDKKNFLWKTYKLLKSLRLNVVSPYTAFCRLAEQCSSSPPELGIKPSQYWYIKLFRW